MQSPAERLIENLPLIDRITSVTCRRMGMSAADAEEFHGHLLLRLVENDYGILRAFRNRSSFSAYLAVVVSRTLIDYRNRLWGRWRPSAAAEKLGEPAVELERLLYRSYQSAEDA